MTTELNIKKNHPLAPLTTFKIGGPAKFFVEVKKKDELVEAIKWAKEHKEKVYFLAGGSNVLIKDKGIDGLVIKLDNNNVKVLGKRIECGAGAALGLVVNQATSRGLSGMENFAGIPGSIGGAIRGNAGAFGQAIHRVIEMVEVYDKAKEKFMFMSKRECEFDYRHSIFKKNTHLLVWSATLLLEQGDSGEIQDQVTKNISYRARSQPKLPSGGCVFKNLLIKDLDKVNPELANTARAEGVEKGGKVAAGWLIDRLNLKGKAMGQCKISLEHANFVVNTNKAQAKEVTEMINFIKKQVKDKFNVLLVEEIEYFGVK